MSGCPIFSELLFESGGAKMGLLVPLDGLREGKYGHIICYPRYSSEQIERRLEEIRALGIDAVEFVGESSLFGLPVLGKGYVGVVVLAYAEFGRVALKIRRTDADRSGMMREAEMLQMANSVGVGPRLVDSTEDFLVMEFVDGMLFPKWIKHAAETEAKNRIRKVLRDAIEQSWRLDELGLDHGELSRASKHIKINSEDKAYILDFETASRDRRTSNVTSICQYLFMRSEVSEAVKKSLGEIERGDLIRALRRYKGNCSRKRFNEVLGVCRL